MKEKIELYGYESGITQSGGEILSSIIDEKQSFLESGWHPNKMETSFSNIAVLDEYLGEDNGKEDSSISIGESELTFSNELQRNFIRFDDFRCMKCGNEAFVENGERYCAFCEKRNE